MKAKVVTAFVPLEVRHQTALTYKALGDRLVRAVGADKIRVFDNFPFEDCWCSNLSALPPASAVPSDRYATPADMVKSNIVQHQRTTWAMMAAAEDPSIDVIIWLDYGILKQGDWTGRPVTEEIVAKFIQRIEEQDNLDGVPFPAIWGKGPISDNDVNWRFCGSTHIWPTKWLPAIDRAYKDELMKFVTRVGAVPNDLPIWAHVEENYPEIPFKGYSGNHDATQLTNFRGTVPLTPLCELAEKHHTDKGPYHGYTPVYHELLNGRRESTRRVLEVGIGYAGRGHTPFWPFGASLKMWEEYFPGAVIYGVDIAPEVMINQGRIHSSLCDQSRASSLIDTAERLGGDFDLIVDDGSHELEHQILTVNILLRYLKPNGIFVIEDVNMDPSQITNRLPPGYAVQSYRSHAEPAHAYLMVIRRV